MNQVNVLIVEDKCENLRYLKEIIRSDHVNAITVQTVIAAQKHLVNNDCDLLITDIFIPDDIGEDINTQGGVELLDWVTQVDPKYRPKRIIGLTSTIESYEQNLHEFFSRGCLLLHANPMLENWIEPITSTCEYLYNNEDADSQETKETPELHGSFDIVFLTALGHNELKAIHDLDMKWEEFRLTNDPSIYYKSTINTSFGERSVVSLHAPRMGMSASASLTTKVINKFSPKYIIMTGIAAGIKGKCNFGDVLAAEFCWDWGNGKQTKNNEVALFKPAPHQVPIASSLGSIIQKVRDQSLYVDDIYRSWRGPKPPSPLNVVFGPLASGSVVLEDPTIVDTITEHCRETVGIDMEAYGVCAAATIAVESAPKVLILKSVCDFADPEKNDDWQDYASFTSAQLAYRLIQNDLAF
ncbi:TPA: hypothetical protein ACY4P0_004059 [Vibrio parahaemolyticus]